MVQKEPEWLKSKHPSSEITKLKNAPDKGEKIILHGEHDKPPENNKKKRKKNRKKRRRKDKCRNCKNCKNCGCGK